MSICQTGTGSVHHTNLGGCSLHAILSPSSVAHFATFVLLFSKHSQLDCCGSFHGAEPLLQIRLLGMIRGCQDVTGQTLKLILKKT